MTDFMKDVLSDFVDNDENLIIREKDQVRDTVSIETFIKTFSLKDEKDFNYKNLMDIDNGKKGYLDFLDRLKEKEVLK